MRPKRRYAFRAALVQGGAPWWVQQDEERKARRRARYA